MAAAVTGAGRLTGYDDRTGVTRWTFGGLDANPSLTVLGDRAVATWLFPSPRGTTILAAIDVATGRIRWQVDMGRTVGGDGALFPAHDARGWPAVLATDTVPGRLWLLSLGDGHLQWSAPAPLVPGTAALLAGADIVTFQAPHANTGNFGTPPDTAGLRLVSTSTATGAIRWSQRIPQSASGPAVRAGPDIVVRSSRATASGQVPGVLLAYRTATGQPAWRVTLPAPAWAPPAPAPGGLVAQAGYDTAVCAMPP